MFKSVYAVFGDNPPPVVVESCTFVNFPVQSDYQSAAVGLRSTYANDTVCSRVLARTQRFSDDLLLGSRNEPVPDSFDGITNQ